MLLWQVACKKTKDQGNSLVFFILLKICVDKELIMCYNKFIEGVRKMKLYMAYVDNFGHIMVEQNYYKEKGNKYIGLKWNTKVYKNQINKLIPYYPFYKVYSFSEEKAKEILFLAAKEEKEEIEKHLILLNNIIIKQEYNNKYGNRLGEYLYSIKGNRVAI